MLVFHNAPRVPLARLYSVHNQPIVNFLIRCQKEEESRQDTNTFKVTAYKHAIHSISQFQHPIRLGNDISKLPGVGPSIMSKINDFLYASKALEAHHPQLLAELQKARLVKMLQDIPGIGPVTAQRLADAGCNSVEKLPEFTSLLNTTQKVKVKYMRHLDQTIEREDAEDAVDFCRQSLDSGFEYTLVGEYRREISPIPIIRLMLTHPEFVYVPLPSYLSPLITTPAKKLRSKSRKTAEKKETTLFQSSVLPTLQQRGLIAETFSSTKNSWDGIIRLPDRRGEWGDRAERVASIEDLNGRFRRMSIDFASYQCRGTAILALTGDSGFFKHLQFQAKQMGLLLNEYGLWRWIYSHSSDHELDESTNGGTDEEKGYWSFIKTSSEAEVFEELGIDFIAPSKRNFAFISGRRSR